MLNGCNMDIESRDAMIIVLKQAKSFVENQNYQKLYTLSNNIEKALSTLYKRKWLFFHRLPVQYQNTPGTFVEEILDYWCFDSEHGFEELEEKEWIEYCNTTIQEIQKGVAIEQLKKPWEI